MQINYKPQVPESRVCAPYLSPQRYVKGFTVLEWSKNPSTIRREPESL